MMWFNKSLKRFVFFVLWLIGGPVFSAANTENPAVTEVFSLIYNQQFEKADSVLKVRKPEISEFFETFLTLDLHYWKCTTLDTKEEYKRFEEILRTSMPEDTGSELNTLKSMVVYIYSLRYYYKNLQLVRFNIALMKMKNLEKKIDAEILDAYGKGAELMKIYYSMYTYFISKLRSFPLIPKNTPSADLALLKQKCQDKGLIINTLAHYFVGKIYLQFEKDPKQALFYFDILTQRFPGNEKFRELARECRGKT
jgi:hypothetical protein